jgi:hypothetical protein
VAVVEELGKLLSKVFIFLFPVTDYDGMLEELPLNVL